MHAFAGWQDGVVRGDWRLSWIGLAALLFVGCRSEGQRLLHARVEVDGRPLLETYFSQSDAATTTEAWRRLADQELELIEGTEETPVAIEIDERDPRRATVRGKIRLALRHADSPYAYAELDGLKLERDAPDSKFWRIPRDELRRAAPF